MGRQWERQEAFLLDSGGDDVDLVTCNDGGVYESGSAP